MKERKRRNKKILGLINVVVIVYIFTLVIGYSFFRESLKISGNVSTEKPKDCPFELQELTSKLYTDEQLSEHSYFFNKYFAEYSSFRWNDHYLAAEDEIYDDSGLGGLVYIFTAIDTFPFDYYDMQNNTLSIYATHNNLYPFDEHNMQALVGYDKMFYSVLARPMYFIFENKTAQTLDSFVISVDEENNPFILHDFDNDPLGAFDIRVGKMSSEDLYRIVDVISDDYNTGYDLYAGWVEGSGFKDNEPLQSVFQGSGLSQVDNAPNDSYYSTDEFQDGTLIEFQTEPIEPGDYLVMGVMFLNTTISEWDNWGELTISSLFSDAIKEPDGIAFKFWPSNFAEESAFHVRFGFDSLDEKVNYFEERLSYFEDLDLDTFYKNPSSFTQPISWWSY